MDKRLELQTLLEQLLGSKNVYFEPPPNFTMKYPCIRYKRVRYDAQYADNRPSKLAPRYELTFIYRDPDNETVEAISWLPMCSHDRHYTADNLSHDVFTLTY